MVLVSIIVPIYNAEKYLKQCLKSIKNQTLKDIEIICVDDGSTDASAQIMDEFQKKDNRFIVIHKENGGNGHSMNAGLSIAKGEYIGCVEADDFIEQNMFEKLYMLSNGGKIDIVKSNFWNCYEDANGGMRRVINQERANMPEVITPFTIKEYPQILWGHPSIWSAIYKKSLLEENDIKFKEAKGGGWVDNPFFFETMCCAKSIIWTSRPFYCYRTGVEGASSNGYDFSIPFDRMSDNLKVLKARGYEDEETLKFAYARALMYLCGALKESDYEGKENKFYEKAQEMLSLINPTVIFDDFNASDQKLFLKFSSPLKTLVPEKKKVLIYNWVPFDNPSGAGGGVTIYCKNLIQSIINNRPDVDVYFLSSGWAYDISTDKCYIRRINNIFGERCKSYEIINSPVPAPQDMLFANPEVAFENQMLKKTVRNFLKKYGEFEVVHFNNMEGLSFDVFDLKKEFTNTKFIYSLHNYVPICMTGFYFMRHEHHSCNAACSSVDCDKCIDRSSMRNFAKEMIDRGKVNYRGSVEEINEYRWNDIFAFDRLNVKKDASTFIEFKNRATKCLNKNMDCILAVSKRVYEIAVDNKIDKNKLVLSYIGTRVAEFQLGRSNSTCGKYFKIAYLGSVLEYEEKGYPFLLASLEKLEKKYASKIDLVLTTITKDKNEYIRSRLRNFHKVKIIHGYKHSDLNLILTGVDLGIIPVLWEDNLPQIAIEMVAYGVPILCSDAGGASELSANDAFKFQAGNSDHFLKKLIDIVNQPELLSSYWESHRGLITNQMHYKEIERIYGFKEVPDLVISAEEYNKLIMENEFLYKHFSEENISDYQNEIERLNKEIIEVQRQRDDLQWRLDETRKSKTYKIGMAITAIPRKLCKS